MRRGAADINLLLVFEALLQERSVTRAADRLSLSQPAMSHALNRLRSMLGDVLFVRTSAGMVPTARAEELSEPVRSVIAQLEELLGPPVFTPETDERDFVIMVNNYAAIVLIPTLVARCAALAPLIRLIIRPSGTLDVVAALTRGDVDLTLGGR